MDPFSILTGLFSSGMSMLNQNYNSAQQVAVARENTDKTIKANRDMAEYAYSKDLEMWNRNNQYNTPQQQMARLRSGGLNPNLVYGTGTVSGNTSGNTPKFQAPTAEYKYQPRQQDLPATISAFQNMQMQRATLDQTRAQTENVKQNTANGIIDGLIKTVEANNAQTKTGQENLSRRLMNDQAQQTLDQYVKTAPYQLSILQQQSRQASADTQLKIGALGLQEKESMSKELANEYQKWVNSLAQKGVTPSDNYLMRQAPNLLEGAKNFSSDDMNSFFEWLSRKVRGKR